MAATLGELAGRFGLTLHGDPDAVIDGVGTLRDAGTTEIAFFANTRYRRQLRDTRAGAVVLAAADVADSPVPVLVSGNPYASYARIASALHPPAAHAALPRSVAPAGPASWWGHGGTPPPRCGPAGTW